MLLMLLILLMILTLNHADFDAADNDTHYSTDPTADTVNGHILMLLMLNC